MATAMSLLSRCNCARDIRALGVSNVQIAPLEVQATGLQNTLAGLVLLATDPIDITGAKADIVRTVTLRPPDGVTVNQKTAQVHIFISPIPGVTPSSSP